MTRHAEESSSSSSAEDEVSVISVNTAAPLATRPVSQAARPAQR